MCRIRLLWDKYYERGSGSVFGACVVISAKKGKRVCVGAGWRHVLRQGGILLSVDHRVVHGAYNGGSSRGK